MISMAFKNSNAEGTQVFKKDSYAFSDRTRFLYSKQEKQSREHRHQLTTKGLCLLPQHSDLALFLQHLLPGEQRGKCTYIRMTPPFYIAMTRIQGFTEHKPRTPPFYIAMTRIQGFTEHKPRIPSSSL